MDKLEIIKRPVEKEIEEFENYFKSHFKSNVPLLSTITNYVLRRKGKQIRPLLVLLSASMCGKINRSTYTAATLIEFLHTATLVHDDIVDESYERRHHFSVNAIWKSKVAVLVGDYLLSKGFLISIAEKEFGLLESVSDSVKEMVEGELLQLKSSQKIAVDLDNYFQIIKSKTASLISTCTLCGAQSVTSDKNVHQLLKEYGLYVGTAFQIKDDLFDYQKKNIIGKPIGNDIKDKKFTLPLILAMKNAKESDRKNILRKINMTFSFVKYNEILDFVIENNGIKDSETYLEMYKNKALDILKNFPENDARKSLELFAEFVITREK